MWECSPYAEEEGNGQLTIDNEKSVSPRLPISSYPRRAKHLDISDFVSQTN